MVGGSLFVIADYRIAQSVLQRAEPGLVVPPLVEPLGKDRLADLFRARRVDTAFQLVELDAGRFKFEAAKFQDASNVAL